MGTVTVVVHRGTHQIGGCCTEITTASTRILIDFGANLPDEPVQELKVAGATDKTRRCDGILVTHYHGDHIGELPNVRPDVPIYMGAAAAEIQNAYKAHMGKAYMSGVDFASMHYLADRRRIDIGDISITPIQTDHSAFQPFMFLIEAGGKRILHTGDFRLHGRHRAAVYARLKPLSPIDLLITEGTTLSRTDVAYLTEDDITAKYVELMEKYKYCFMITASGNIDRMESFANAIPLGKYFLMDKFQKGLLDIAKEYSEEARCSFQKAMTIGNNLMMEERGFGMLVRANPFFEQFLTQYMAKHPSDTCLIYSMWSGYKKQERLAAFCAIARDNIKSVHSSGHAVMQDLNDLINRLSPQKIIFIHTDAQSASANIDLKDRVVALNDKEEYRLCETQKQEKFYQKASRWF